jgi:hypothetical protein
MGGKSGTTTQSVSIPPEVMRRYNAVNARAEQVAGKPFQPYTGQFVAGITPTQQAGIAATGQYAQAAQPYFQAATGQLGQAQGQGQQAIQQAFGSLGQGVDVGQQYAQAATGGIGGALQFAQPYLQGATGAAVAGSEAITPDNINIQGYMNPYTQAVADTTFQALRQQQQQEMAGQTANAIKSGAFGGDRAGLVAANLARQQQLGTAQAMAPIYQQGYGQALGSAMTAAQSNRAALQNLSQQLQGIGQAGYGQQMGAAQQLAGLGQQQFGQGLGAAQQLGALGQQQYGMGAGTAQQLAALGTGAQAAGLQGAQAQLGAGTLEQQTQQADLTARYQQFLQERGYDFQVAQFLANIAMGTGALSGSTTTTTQPMPFFSDRRVKHDVKEIGKTHDGQPIYSFKYNGDKATQIGLMAQDVEKKHPEAVYDMDGIKGVDYEEATKNSARPERYSGGLVPASMGGSVYESGAYARGGYLAGGLVDPNDIQALLAAQREAMGPFAEGGIYGSHHAQDTPFGNVKGIVPPSRVHTGRLMQPNAPPPLPESTAKQALSAYDSAMGMGKRFNEAKGLFSGEDTPQKTMDKTRQGQTGTDRSNLPGPDIVPDKKPEDDQGILDYIGSFFKADGGGVMPRSHYAIGGASKDPSLPYDEEDKSPYKYFPTEILDTNKAELPKPGAAPTQTSQTGVGMGDLAKLAMFFLKDGGVVPRAHYQDGGDADLERYLNAIAKIESSNNPKAIGPQTKSGDRAYGLYQVMGTNVPSWTEEAVGRRMTPDEFLADEEAQRATARHHFGKSLKQYGNPEDAASVWFSGRPMSKAGNASDVLGTTVPDYINKFRAAADLPTIGAKPSGGIVPAGKEESAGVSQSSKEGATGIVPQIKSYLSENQDFLVPLGAGLRGMVQSRSPFLGGALIEGIGSGLEAIGPAQARLAEIGLTRAQEEVARVGAGKIYEVGNRLFVPYKGRNIRASEYFRLAPQDRPKLSEEDVRRLEEDAKKDGNIPVPEVPSPTTTTGDGGAAPQPIIEQTPNGSVSVNLPGVTPSRKFLTELSPTEKQQMDREIAVTQDFEALPSDAKTPYNVQRDIAGQVQDLKVQMNNLGMALSSLPAGESLATSGKAQQVFAPITATLDNLSRMITGSPLMIRDEDRTNMEIVGKAISNLSGLSAVRENQSAYAALREMAERFPTLQNSPEGQKALWSELRVMQQREIDKADYFKALQTYAEQNGDPMTAGHTARAADAMFNAKFTQEMFKNEEKILQRMWEERPAIMGADGKIREHNQTWMQYLMTNPNPPPDLLEYARALYGDRILRYFGK